MSFSILIGIVPSSLVLNLRYIVRLDSLAEFPLRIVIDSVAVQSIPIFQLVARRHCPNAVALGQRTLKTARHVVQLSMRRGPSLSGLLFGQHPIAFPVIDGLRRRFGSVKVMLKMRDPTTTHIPVKDRDDTVLAVAAHEPPEQPQPSQT